MNIQLLGTRLGISFKIYTFFCRIVYFIKARLNSLQYTLRLRSKKKRKNQEKLVDSSRRASCLGKHEMM